MAIYLYIFKARKDKRYIFKRTEIVPLEYIQSCKLILLFLKKKKRAKKVTIYRKEQGKKKQTK